MMQPNSLRLMTCPHSYSCDTNLFVDILLNWITSFVCRIFIPLSISLCGVTSTSGVNTLGLWTFRALLLHCSIVGSMMMEGVLIAQIAYHTKKILSPWSFVRCLLASTIFHCKPKKMQMYCVAKKK